MRWGLVVAGLILIGTTVWASVTGFVGLTGSHPIGWITNVGSALVGIGMSAAGSVRRLGPHEVSRRRRWSGRVAVTLATVVLAGTVVFTRPLSAEQVALDALADGAGVDVSDGATSLTMQPDSPARTGLVFYPGARVDPRAYAHFGDYGRQRGDGDPTIDRETAQRRIVAATLALLERADTGR